MSYEMNDTIILYDVWTNFNRQHHKSEDNGVEDNRVMNNILASCTIYNVAMLVFYNMS